MIEKVNPSHPDKIMDRIAGAIVDLCYTKQTNPKIAVEGLIGHGHCTIIAESSVDLTVDDIQPIVNRIAGEGIELKFICVPQDEHLAENQSVDYRCGDNGIFKGVPLTDEEMTLTTIAQDIYNDYPTDGKYVLNEKDKELIVCQSHLEDTDKLYEHLHKAYPQYTITINPLGYWTGSQNVDTGAVNRKLGSDMGHSVTGGGIHGKDISKSDVTINIYCWLEAQRTGKTKELSCAIGDHFVDGRPYGEIVQIAQEYINQIGGYEALAEWGLW
jgi:S-adenosylmethionine synthetase